MKVRLLSVLILVSAQFVVSIAPQAKDRTEAAGDLLQYLLPVCSLGATAIHKDGDGAKQLLKSYLLSTSTTALLKGTVHARRPNGGMHSFPSGHATDVFTGAEFLRVRYGLKWGLPAYLAAGFTAYSRVEAHKHHPRDVVAGAAIGIASAHIFTRPFHGWDVSLTTGHGGIAVMASKRF